MRQTRILFAVIALSFLFPFAGKAQTTEPYRHGEFYFSWGYNTEDFTHSNLKISQPALGNNYTFENIKGHDHKGWNEGLLSEALTIPQYNYRIGYFFGNKKDLGVEINFDHTKFIFGDNQIVHIKGTMNSKPYNGYALFKQNTAANADSSSYYFLNNGANFLLFNIVKRWHLEKKNKKDSVRRPRQIWYWPGNSACTK